MQRSGTRNRETRRPARCPLDQSPSEEGKVMPNGINRRRLVVSSVGIVGLGTVAAALYWKQEAPASAPSYTVARVTRGDITQSVNANGKLTPFVRVEVHTQIK